MRTLIISDVHGNIWALEAIEKAAGPVDRIIFLGDAVDYGPKPKECIDWLREWAWKCLRGNHDNSVLTQADCQCSEAFKEYSNATRVYMWKILDDQEYKFLEPLKPEARFELDGKKIYAAHAAPSDPIFKYIRPETPDEELLIEVKNIEADIVMLGHTHFPMDRTIAGVKIINPGSAGQPRDGDPRAGYALMQDGEITLHRVEYDKESACRALEKCPLEAYVIERLTTVLSTGK